MMIDSMVESSFFGGEKMWLLVAFGGDDYQSEVLGSGLPEIAVVSLAKK